MMDFIFIYLLSMLLFIKVGLADTFNNTAWPNISSQVEYGLRSQRDIQKNITIDQLPLVGVDLQRVLFNQYLDDNSIMLYNFYNLMRQGVQSFVLEIEISENAWVVTNTSLLLLDVFSLISAFLQSTNTNLNANIMVLLLKVSQSVNMNPLHIGNSSALFLPSKSNNTNICFNSNCTSSTFQLETNNTDTSIFGDYSQTVPSNISISNLNITSLLDDSLGTFIYSPQDLETDRIKGYTWNGTGYPSSTGWPTLSTFLTRENKRILIADLSATSDYIPSDYIFNNSILHYDYGNMTLGCPNTIPQIKDVSRYSWRFLNSNFTPGDIKNYIDCGYSPIINNPFDLSNITNILPLLNSSLLWSWRFNQPSVNVPLKKHSLEAYNCAIFKYDPSNSSFYWMVDNCYEKKLGLCRFGNEQFTWLVTKSPHTYFDFDSYKGSQCPDNYEFSIPRTPLEQNALITTLKKNSFADIDIWIDLNSISVEDCWVTGGPYAACPYRKSMTRRHFARMLAPACACSFGILCIVFYLNLLRVPIHDNRINWRRKLVREANLKALNTEGVPS
ncbi:hypothetical protein TBLA_0H02250 [Henningerozyma blattae CBS 6284]|uniref:Maintenance of telomere capping protein 6 n=1 Tax=Henningerozyma blattae (strain ATCC 34711 / CBS 6284 / DSM 70876 / NBRC 10599 / NRRL Y-10934 / UCD 77-7) TaxID=1071380 RepID=I2H809_HENB6|nr:hypothetical protein TBLA_0H02250 [Tetrapisispora blattae CBS 6284]CCH62511.1 hypothetical protein TBLA_0H02250 [Tetrapisispora blattae CBS 6284]